MGLTAQNYVGQELELNFHIRAVMLSEAKHL